MGGWGVIREWLRGNSGVFGWWLREVLLKVSGAASLEGRLELGSGLGLKLSFPEGIPALGCDSWCWAVHSWCWAVLLVEFCVPAAGPVLASQGSLAWFKVLRQGMGKFSVCIQFIFCHGTDESWPSWHFIHYLMISFSSICPGLAYGCSWRVYSRYNPSK